MRRAWNGTWDSGTCYSAPCGTLHIDVLLFREQLSGYCNFQMLSPLSSFTDGILKTASFLRDDTVNPIWSSIWRKWHLKLVFLCLSNEPVSSAFEYLWAALCQGCGGEWSASSSFKVFNTCGAHRQGRTWHLSVSAHWPGKANAWCAGGTAADLMGCLKVKEQCHGTEVRQSLGRQAYAQAGPWGRQGSSGTFIHVSIETAHCIVIKQ